MPPIVEKRKNCRLATKNRYSNPQILGIGVRVGRVFVLIFLLLLLPLCLGAQNSVVPRLQGFEARAVAVTSSDAAWGGMRGESEEQTLSDRVVDYEISAELDPETHRVAGVQTLRWRNRSNIPISTVYLHLYLNAFANADSTYMRETQTTALAASSPDSPQAVFDAPLKAGEWGSIRVSNIVQKDAETAPISRFVQPDGGPITDQTVLALDLAKPVAPGATLELTMQFVSQLPRVIARTGYFKTFHMVAQWFPKIAVLELPGERGADAVRWNAHEFHQKSEFYADFGSFDVALTVPGSYTIAATGKQTALTELGGKRQYHFQQADVIDFAWAADSRFAAPLLAKYSRTGKPDVEVKVFYTPDYAASAAPALAATIKAMRYASDTLGEYPFDTVSVIVPPLNAQAAGGMEYPTLFTVDGYTQAQAGSYAAAALEFVAIHEFTHNYFQGIVASNEFEEPMLDEGVNQYWNERLLRDAKSPMPLPDGLQRFGFAQNIGRFEYERWAADLADPTDALGQNAWSRYSAQSVNTVYSRTATMLRDLEARWGSAVMALAMRTYYQRWKFRHPSVADFQAVLMEVSRDAEHVTRVFAQNVYVPANIKSGTMDDRVTALVSTRQASSARFETLVTVRHLGVHVPQVLRVRFQDGTSQVQSWAADDVAGTWRRLRFLSDTQALSAELDPERRYYLDQSLIDNTRTLKADSQASSRWMLELGAALSTLYAMVLNL